MKPRNIQNVVLAGPADLAAASYATPNLYDLWNIHSDDNNVDVQKVDLTVWVGRAITTAFTAGYPSFELRGRHHDDDSSATTEYGFNSLLQDAWQPAAGSSVASTTVNGATAAGATSLTVASATGIAVGDLLFLGDASTANYEVACVKAISTNTIYFTRALRKSHSNGALVTSKAEQKTWRAVDLAPYRYVNFEINNLGNATQGIKYAITLSAHLGF